MVTVNDYLATRDSEWMGQLHRFLGLTVGRVGPDIEDAEAKREAYFSDVTYGTNTEFGFDYLRDNMARSKDAMVQRGHPFAIVDEVDSILIDEARTPLIISGPAAESAQLYYQFAGIVRTLRAEDDYEVDEEKRIVVPTEAGIEKVETQLGVGQPVRRGGGQLRAPPDPGPAGQGALPPGQGLSGGPGRGQDRRRVHRADPRRAALVRRPPPGRRGQGAGADQRGEPHLGHGHPPELLPALREAVGDDRDGGDRGIGVRQHLRAPRRAHPAQQAADPRGQPRPDLQVRGRQVRRRGR